MFCFVCSSAQVGVHRWTIDGWPRAPIVLPRARSEPSTARDISQGGSSVFPRDQRGAHLRISNFECRRRPEPTFPCRPAESILPIAPTFHTTPTFPCPFPLTRGPRPRTPASSPTRQPSFAAPTPVVPAPTMPARLARWATARAQPKRRAKRPLG